MNQRRKIELLLLTAAAGVLDALCYLQSRVFAANMTGNVVLLGLDLVRNHHDHGAWYALSIAAFSAGAFIAAVILVRRPRPGHTDPHAEEIRKGTTLEFPFVLAFAAISLVSLGDQHPWARAGVILAGASAMGVQSIAVRRLRVAGVVTTFITGTLTTALVEAVSGGHADERKAGSPVILVAMLLIYIAAAAFTALWSWTRLPQVVPVICVAAVRFSSRR